MGNEKSALPKNQKEDLIELIKTIVPYASQLVEKVIEYQFCSYAMENRKIFEVSHENDSPWEWSGEVFYTGKNLSINSEMTLQQISELYTGFSEQTFCIGYSSIHQTFADDCSCEITNAIVKLMKIFVTECIERKLFPEYMSKLVRQDINLPVDEDDISELATYISETYFPFDASSFLEEEPVGEQKLCDVYQKYKNVQKYGESFDSVSCFSNEKMTKDIKKLIDSYINHKT